MCLSCHMIRRSLLSNGSKVVWVRSSQMAALWAIYSFHTHFLETHKGHVVGQKRGLTQQNVLFFPSAFSTDLAPINFKTENDKKKIKKKKREKESVTSCLLQYHIRARRTGKKAARQAEDKDRIGKWVGRGESDGWTRDDLCVKQVLPKTFTQHRVKLATFSNCLGEEKKKNKQKKHNFFFQIKIWQ